MGPRVRASIVQHQPANAAIVCKNCFQTNYSSNGSLCKWCQKPLPVASVTSTHLDNISVSRESHNVSNERTKKDETRDSEYYDSIAWDIDTNVTGGIFGGGKRNAVDRNLGISGMEDVRI